MLRIKKIKGEEGDCLEDDKVQEGDEKDLRRKKCIWTSHKSKLRAILCGY